MTINHTAVWLRNLADRLMSVPVMYGVDQSDAESLLRLAAQLGDTDPMRTEDCESCHGTGGEVVGMPEQCADCNGQGVITL